MATPRLSLAQQIAQLEEAVPVDRDLEDVRANGMDIEVEIYVESAAREHYLEVGPSALRRLHDSTSDPKYEGVTITRKQLLENSDMESGNENDDVGEEEKQSEAPEGSDDNNEVLSSTIRKTREEDRKKGQAVSRQIAIWDTLLNSRIRLQKMVNAANRLPPPAELQLYITSVDCSESMSKLLKEATLLSEDLFELQEFLLIFNEPFTVPPRKRQKVLSEGTLFDHTAHFHDATQAASVLEQAFHPHMIQILSKWSAKVQAVAPSVLLPSNRNAFSKDSQHIKSIIQLVDETLTDYVKMLARTQIRREYDTRMCASQEGGADQPKEGSEVFDDTDFYQQLLRDIIDARGNATGVNDWMVAQKQKKAKKNVDTKASKGRKLRYEVHEKLQNFMVPVPAIGMWHDEQIDELFASLLGRGFEGSAVNNDENELDKEIKDRLGEALKDGFRVFG